VPRFDIAASRSAALATAVALAALCLPARGRAGEPRGWTALASVQFALFAHTQEPLPIGEPPDVGVAMFGTLSPPRSRFALRFDAGIVVNGSMFPDTAALLYGEPWPYPVDVSVGVDEEWVTLGVQWDPRPGESGFYAFVTAGGMWVSSRTTILDNNLTLPDAPPLPAETAVFCGMAGGGARWVFGPRKSHHKNHSLHLEVGYLHAGAADYLGAPEVSSTLDATDFPTVHGNIAGVTVRVGYAYVFRWGKPPAPH
jgi:hypothetical protein